MIYRDFQGIQLSNLGFGAMRLPVEDGNDAVINEAAALEMVEEAYRSGINYYDTAWGYHAICIQLVHQPMLRGSFQVRIQIISKHKLRILQRIVVDQVVKLRPLVHIVGNLVFNSNRIHRDHAAIGEFQFHTGSIHVAGTRY